jgi:DNA-binding HxlR family transcriptional regulator
MKYNVFNPGCPTRKLLDRIGDKWTVLIVLALAPGSLRFGELKRALGGPAPKVLTAVLRSLEADGIVSRSVFTGSPLRVEYDLTALGRSLLDAVGHLRQWAEKNMAKVSKARDKFDQATET